MRNGRRSTQPQKKSQIDGDINPFHKKLNNDKRGKRTNCERIVDLMHSIRYKTTAIGVCRHLSMKLTPIQMAERFHFVYAMLWIDVTDQCERHDVGSRSLGALQLE